MKNVQAKYQPSDDETTVIAADVELGAADSLSETAVHKLLDGATPDEDSLGAATGIAKGIVASIVVWVVIVAALILLL